LNILWIHTNINNNKLHFYSGEYKVNKIRNRIR
jgi:hypothetical protein